MRIVTEEDKRRIEDISVKIKRCLEAKMKIGKRERDLRDERERLGTKWEVGDKVYHKDKPAVIASIAGNRECAIKIALITKTGQPSKRWQSVWDDLLLRGEETK